MLIITYIRFHRHYPSIQHDRNFSYLAHPPSGRHDQSYRSWLIMFRWKGTPSSIKMGPKILLGIIFILHLQIWPHCKPKPCKIYRELPLSQFSQEQTFFHYREPCSHCRDPVFITGISLQTPVLPSMGLQCSYFSWSMTRRSQDLSLHIGSATWKGC